MRLTEKQIRQLTVGAVEIERENDGYHFYKCTKKQRNAWYSMSQALGDRALTTTGIRLDFHTNSKTLAFFPTKGGKFEVLVDGVLRRQFHGEELRMAGTPACMELLDPLGERKELYRVTLILPSHSVGVLEYVELEDGAQIFPHEFDRKLLFIGDSITQGWDTSYDCMSYAWRVSLFFNANSIVHGVGGGRFDPTLVDQIDFDPDTVFTAFGTNDFGHFPTLDAMRHATRDFLTKIADMYADKRVVVISPIWREIQKKPMGSFREARQIVIDEAHLLGLLHIDGLSLVPPMPEFFADKTLHPDALGFSLYAEALLAQLIRLD